jgi:hypothetical protein
MPEASLPGSTAEPKKYTRFVLTSKPLTGEVTETVGALVSGWPPGIIRSLIEPALLGATDATAIL